MKEIVRIRKKALKHGGYSLYLETSQNGERTYEFPRLYLVPEKSLLDKDRNRATMEAARTLQARRIIEIQEGIAGIRHVKKQRFTEVIDEYIDAHTKPGSSYRKLIRTARNAWASSGRNHIMLQDIDGLTMQCFARDLANSSLSSGSVRRYYDLICTVINDARKRGLCSFDPGTQARPKSKSRMRTCLSLEEVRTLAATPCPDDMTKRAFLFGCVTGLRISDIRRLNWTDIKGESMNIQMVKTGEWISVPISDNARAWLPEPGEGKVFPLKGETQCYRYLRAWAKEAGLSGLTFHVARHTFATLLLTFGADIYTVSKLLGHHNVATTQIYAKIVDKKKTQAVNLIPGIK